MKKSIFYQMIPLVFGVALFSGSVDGQNMYNFQNNVKKNKNNFNYHNIFHKLSEHNLDDKLNASFYSNPNDFVIGPNSKNNSVTYDIGNKYFSDNKTPTFFAYEKKVDIDKNSKLPDIPKLTLNLDNINENNISYPKINIHINDRVNFRIGPCYKKDLVPAIYIAMY